MSFAEFTELANAITPSKWEKVKRLTRSLSKFKSSGMMKAVASDGYGAIPDADPIEPSAPTGEKPTGALPGIPRF